MRRRCWPTPTSRCASGTPTAGWTISRATATATSCCSCTPARAICSATTAISRSRKGDYLVLPRSTMWRIECAEPVTMLMIEATGGTIKQPDRGMVGRHALYDEAMLDTPKIDDAFRAQQDENEWRVVIKRRGELSVVTYPFNPLDAEGWHGDLARGAAQHQGHPAADEPPLSSAAVGAHHLGRQPVRGLHLHAAPVRDRPGRAEGAVLPQQRRLRRGHLLPRGQFHLARQHRGRAR